MPALDVFALTPVRRSEGVPTVLLEALWAGLPCVATDVGGVGEVVHDDVGALCRPESTDSIAGALARVLDAGEAGRRRMAEHARTMAEERFTLEQCTAAHVQAYDLARRRHASRGASPARPESSPGREVGT
jgi:glycosyltransferase involved in cell wall biosynthesis